MDFSIDLEDSFLTNKLFNIPSNCGSIETEVPPIVEFKAEE
jgi:hypothetical protein